MTDFDDEIALRCAEIKAAGGSPVIHVTKNEAGTVTRVRVFDGGSPRPKRSSNKIPGWDCPNGNCAKPGCTTRTHGIHAEEWVYVLTSADKETVGTLTVNSQQHLQREAPPRVPDPRDITLHVAFNYRHNGELREATRSACCWLDNRPGNCEKTSYLDAEPVWAAGNKTTFEQGEEFWLAFEEWFAKADAAVRATRTTMATDTCPHCGGSGRVNQLAALGEALGVVGMVGEGDGVFFGGDLAGGGRDDGTLKHS